VRNPPWRWDLRRAGWLLAEHDEPGAMQSGYPVLIEYASLDRRRAGRERMIVLGVDSADERARLLAEGVADALCGAVGLAELSARAHRVEARSSLVARRRHVGPVTLDLYHRDAQVAGRWIALFPREFELFWRLSEQCGARLSRRQLLRDVWRLDHDPETNRVEVHISRLRAKLAFAGAGDMIGTDPAGGYFIRASAFDFDRQPSEQVLLDAHLRAHRRMREKG
jgi:DNA-binding response OmpR family regulator